jgi:hypothetical protein
MRNQRRRNFAVKYLALASLIIHIPVAFCGKGAEGLAHPQNGPNYAHFDLRRPLAVFVYRRPAGGPRG